MLYDTKHHYISSFEQYYFFSPYFIINFNTLNLHSTTLAVKVTEHSEYDKNTILGGTT